MLPKEIRGYGQNQGPALVTIGGAPLGLPRLTKNEARHSPDGFQWGYHGSGPAELARAILIAVCRDDEHVARDPRCYQTFKAEVISKLPPDGWAMLDTEVLEWMERFKTITEIR